VKASPIAPAPPRTKIVCTLGPASTDPAVLERLIRAGMNVARLNFSHGDHRSHGVLLAALRQAAARAGRPVGVLQDLCGPKIRMGDLPDGAVELADGQEVVLRSGPPPAHAGVPGLPVQYEGLAQDVAPGDRLLFDDGALEARVVGREGPAAVRVTFVRGGRLRSRKGINLPGVRVSAPSVTAKDMEDLEWGLAHRVDLVALSFVRHPDDLAPVRARLARVADPPLLVSKIEKPEALDHLEAIVRASDAVMVARGDLGVELDYARVPLIQKRVIRLANEWDVPVITATQMLESMTESPRLTRAEASDVQNAILDGTDAVMLSGETAAGRYPVEAVAAMSALALEAERHLLAGDEAYRASARETRTSDLHDALALGAERIARSLEVRAIVLVTRSGRTARYVASSRPRVPVLALTANPRAVGRLALYWGITPVERRPAPGVRDLLRLAETAVLEAGLAGPGDLIVVVVGRERAEEFAGRIHVHRLAAHTARRRTST
jgi:pyruvate kinase